MVSGGATPECARSNDLAGRSNHPGSSPAYCFASVIVWTENKNVAISDHFVLFWQWNDVGGLFWWGQQPKKCIQVTWLEDFWPRNDLALLLRLATSTSCHAMSVDTIISSFNRQRQRNLWIPYWTTLTTHCSCTANTVFTTARNCTAVCIDCCEDSS